MRIVLAAVLLVACAREPPRVRPPLPPGATSICEPCVGTLSNHRVGVSNIWARTLAGPDGVVMQQVAAVLSIWSVDEKKSNPDVTVVVGSEVRIGADLYDVLEIDSPPHEPGSVTLRKKSVPAPPP